MGEGRGRQIPLLSSYVVLKDTMSLASYPEGLQTLPFWLFTETSLHNFSFPHSHADRLSRTAGILIDRPLSCNGFHSRDLLACSFDLIELT